MAGSTQRRTGPRKTIATASAYPRYSQTRSASPSAASRSGAHAIETVVQIVSPAKATSALRSGPAGTSGCGATRASTATPTQTPIPNASRSPSKNAPAQKAVAAGTASNTAAAARAVIVRALGTRQQYPRVLIRPDQVGPRTTVAPRAGSHPHSRHPDCADRARVRARAAAAQRLVVVRHEDRPAH